jgi:hypothetical protein
MEKQIINLDALRAESRIITFLEKEYELGYIPSGAAIPILQAYNGLCEKQAKAAGGNDLDALRRYEKTGADEIVRDTIEFVARFCAFFYPDVTPESIAKNATREMVDMFFMEIIGAIIRNSSLGKKAGEKTGDAKKNRTGRDS